MARPLPLIVSDRLVPWREREWPVDWAAEFGHPGERRPLVLEIGFGNGEFLEREARAHPERDHVGIEISWTSATYLFRRLEKHGLDNVRVLLGDAEALLASVFAPNSLAEIFLNHPCPWPKDRHAERRFVRPAPLRLLASRMAAEAPLLVVTDHAAYAAQIAETLEGQSDFAPRFGATEVDEIPGREPTKYQRKAMAQGISIHYFCWSRAARESDAETGSAPNRAPEPMPSLTLSGRVEPDAMMRGFAQDVETLDHDGVATVVKLIRAFRAEGDAPTWLIEALVKEDKLQQQFSIEVVPRGGDALLVKVGSLGSPHPTFGVKRAVWRAGLYLRRAHAGLGLAHHNLGDAAEEL